MKVNYLDIHSHQALTNRVGVLSIRNIRINLENDRIPDEGSFSVGVHPWDTEKVVVNPDFLDQMIGLPNIAAVGECGIDWLRGADITVQINLFKQQALLAETHEKPVIIHCVQAWQEIFAMKKEMQPKVSWIIHGFKGKPELAVQLINHGFYLSFGENILISGSSAATSFGHTSIDRIFLETDVSKCSIEEIYLRAAAIKELPVKALQDSILQNFETITGFHGTS